MTILQADLKHLDHLSLKQAVDYCDDVSKSAEQDGRLVVLADSFQVANNVIDAMDRIIDMLWKNVDKEKHADMLHYINMTFFEPIYKVRGYVKR